MHNFEFPGAIESYADELQQLHKQCNSTEKIATTSVDYLYQKFENQDGANDCVLMRFFRTMSYSDLLPELQNIAQKTIGYVPPGKTNCLTLLATRGAESAWNARTGSNHHQVIPLLSAEIIEQAPMVSQLIRRLGIDTTRVVEPNPTMFIFPKQKRYDVMYAADASLEKDVFNINEFVKPFGVRSVIGCGTLLPTGDMIALLMFMRVYIEEETAMRFQTLTRSLESTINQLPSDTQNRGRILLAANIDSAARISKLLGEQYTVVLATSREQAIQSLDSANFDLIICDQSFDDSRMFDLLIHLKKDRQARTKPFVCYKGGSSALGDDLDKDVFRAATTLGASCYIDGTSMSDDDLFQAMQNYLPKKIWSLPATAR